MSLSYWSTVEQRIITKRLEEVVQKYRIKTKALGDSGVAINGMGYKKAKSLKSQLQKRGGGLFVEGTWTGRCYLQELVRCLLKPFVISASDVDWDVPEKVSRKEEMQSIQGRGVSCYLAQLLRLLNSFSLLAIAALFVESVTKRLFSSYRHHQEPFPTASERFDTSL